MNRFLKFALIAIFASSLFVSCSDDNTDKSPVKVNSIFVINEGVDYSTISSIDKSDIVTNNFFNSINDIPLGKFTQSMGFSEDYAFIVVTNTSGNGYVEIVDKQTFKHVSTISPLSYPREMIIANNKIYISNGNGADENSLKKNSSVLVYDINTFKKISEIPVGAGPEKIVLANNKLYVANSGGWSNDDNTVSVIDIESDKVVNTYTVKACPIDITVDANNNIWAFCKGKADYSNYPTVTYHNSGLSIINTTNKTVKSFDINKIGNIAIKTITASNDKKTVYFMSDAVYAMNIDDTELPTEKFLDKTFYGIDINPETGNLWFAKSNGKDSKGSIEVYNSSAELLKSIPVGFFPNACYFR